MKFSYTHHMPYTDVAEQGQDWPVANKLFDRRRGADMYRAYIDNKVFAEEAGFDWIASNEHHMSPYGLMPNPNLIGHRHPGDNFPADRSPNSVSQNKTGRRFRDHT